MKLNRKNIKHCRIAVLFTILLLVFCLTFAFSIYALPPIDNSVPSHFTLPWYWCGIIMVSSIILGGISLCFVVYNVSMVD